MEEIPNVIRVSKKMTTVDLARIRLKDGVTAIEWLLKTYGPEGDRWKLKNLTYVEFRKDRDADLFLLNWS